KAKIVVTVIGGQGYIFGRGNQQFSPEIIGRLSRDDVIVVASKAKLASLEGRPLLVDTGDEKVDKMLGGYMRVITGLNDYVMYRVAS
ncbi:MAG: NAD(+)/NADH kinase, partial [Thaumarchaeota archaeon]|nr:NAD(+)/NADH kinase [Nitrososphaerota archaeon]